MSILACLFVFAQAQGEEIRHAVKDQGVPAYPNPIKFEQPDGKTVTLTLKGDGALHWAESTDGYKLVKDNRGFFCYGVKDAVKGMIASNVPALDVDARSASQSDFVKSLSRKTFFTKSFIMQRRVGRNGLLKSSDAPSKAFPTSGKRKLLAILVNFSDVAQKRSKAEFNNLFNQKGYSINGSTGSVADYFSDNSFGKMELSVDVVGPYTVSKPMSYYGGNNSSKNDSHPEEMVSEAVQLANNDINFSQYDNDKDGTIDGVYVIFAGYGEEAGASADAIWSHAWQIPTVTYDGVKIRNYSCSPELCLNAKKNPNALITPIGVICHEFLHVCGLPDYYDTDYEESGGESPALGKFDVMSSGSWNNGGNTPPLVNSYSRNMLQWGTLVPFELKKNNTLLPHYSSSKGYIATNKTNEYYVFENRQQVKWDSYIPGHGMVVYHIVYDENIWNQNNINITPTKEYFQLVNAGSVDNSSSSPFPGTSNNSSFTFTTTPSFTNWDGTSLNTPLTNIVETSENISVGVKTMQNITFTVKDGNLPLYGAEIVINNKTYNTNSKGIAQVEISVLDSRDYTVSKLGYISSKATITTDDDTNIDVNLLSNGQPKFVKLMNGTIPISNVKVTLYGNVQTTDANGMVQIPQSSDPIIQPTIEFSPKNIFNQSITLSNTENSTVINFKKIVVNTKSRIGSITSTQVEIANVASVTLNGIGTTSFYIPSSMQQSYDATLDKTTIFKGLIAPTNSPTDTIKIWYNVYSVYTLQNPKPLSNVDILTSDGNKYTTNSDGFFTLYLPLNTEGISLTVSSNQFHQTSKYLNNLTSSSKDVFLNMVSRPEMEHFTIAPNPTTLPIYIYSKEEKAMAYIYTLQGKLVHSQQLTLGVNQVLPPSIQRGSCIVKIQGETQAETKKIIIL